MGICFNALELMLAYVADEIDSTEKCPVRKVAVEFVA